MSTTALALRTPEDSVEKESRFRSALAAAINHPVRVKCMVRMAESPTSASVIADELHMSTGKVGHHIKELHAYGLIELVDQRAVRGAIQNFYVTKTPPMVAGKDWDDLEPEERVSFVELVLSMYAADAANALEGGTLLARDDLHISRTAMMVDEQGWRGLSAVFTTAAEQIAKIKVECEERKKSEERKQKTSDDKGRTPQAWILAYQSLFELPPRPRA